MAWVSGRPTGIHSKLGACQRAEAKPAHRQIDFSVRHFENLPPIPSPRVAFVHIHNNREDQIRPISTLPSKSEEGRRAPSNLLMEPRPAGRRAPLPGRIGAAPGGQLVSLSTAIDPAPRGHRPITCLRPDEWARHTDALGESPSASVCLAHSAGRKQVMGRCPRGAGSIVVLKETS